MSARILNAFTHWFASAGCFWQTTVVLVGIAAVELKFPHLDPHGFWLLWALTLFSGWTQPALAYGNAQSALQTDALLERLEALERQNSKLLAHVGAPE